MTMSEKHQSGISKFEIVVEHDGVTEADIRRILSKGGLKEGTFEVSAE